VTGGGGGGTVVGGGVTKGAGGGTGVGGGGTVVGGGVTKGTGGGTVVGIRAGTCEVVGGGFVAVVGEVALFAWPMGGRLTVLACEPEDCASARPIPAAATAATTTKTIPSRLLIVGSFDCVDESEKPPRLDVGWDL
jgi:hypothetical protein